ncbi:MAG: wax ester/triacylglycerol synthase family O-acyltransferase [Intrasporangium sp.]|nr:wax ester/triacylglycerol synthase family O-acyltransferase [Intrasporangium sp.]
MIFEGLAPTLDAVVAEFEALLPQLPRYRQRVRRVPFDPGLPVWVDDPGFRLRDHVQQLQLPASATDDDLQKAGRRTHLGAARPRGTPRAHLARHRVGAGSVGAGQHEPPRDDRRHSPVPTSSR